MPASSISTGEKLFSIPKLTWKYDPIALCFAQGLLAGQSHSVAAGLSQTRKLPLPKDYLLLQKSKSGGTCQT